MKILIIVFTFLFTFSVYGQDANSIGENLDAQNTEVNKNVKIKKIKDGTNV